MNFIKNNWGFLLCTILCLAGLVTVGIMCSSASKELKAKQEEAQKEESYLDSVAKKKLKLDSENVEIAERNAGIAAEGFEKAKIELGKKFHLEYSVPDNELEGLKDLKDKIENLQKFLDDKGIEFSQTCSYFTFDTIANATEPPHKDDLKEIFRQWTIIDRIVKVAAEAEVQSIDDLQRPLGLTAQEESGYTYTPIEITVSATPEKAQRFINFMNRADKYLFFLRTVEIDAPDVMTEIADDLEETGAEQARNQDGMAGAMGGPMGGMEPVGDMGGGRRGGRRGGRNNDEMMMDGPDAGMGMEGGRRSRSRRRNRNQDDMGGAMPGMMGGPMGGAMGGGRGMMGGAMGGAAGMMGGGMMGAGGEMMGNNAQLIEIPLKRQDLLAFEPKTVQLVLRYDFIDPVKPEEPAEEDASESENQEQE